MLKQILEVGSDTDYPGATEMAAKISSLRLHLNPGERVNGKVYEAPDILIGR